MSPGLVEGQIDIWWLRRLGAAAWRGGRRREEAPIRRAWPGHASPHRDGPSYGILLKLFFTVVVFVE